MKKQLRMILFFLGIGIFLFILSRLLSSPEGTLYTEMDFITFDNVLYSPDEIPELSEGRTGEDHIYWSSQPFTRVRTSVLNIDLNEGEVYGLYSKNLTYAARVWVNGTLLVDQGHVSETKEDFEPKTASVLVYFTAKEHNRIVVQRCNFDHALWNLFDIYVGPQQVITRSVQTSWFKNAALLTFLLTVGIINLGMFAALPGRLRFLWFSLACFFMTVNFAFTNPKLIMLAFPDLNWYLGHKLESCSLILGTLFLLLFFRECFGKANRWVELAGWIIIGFALCWYIFLPASIYTLYGVIVSDVVALYAVTVCVLLIIRAVRQRKNLTVSQRYYLAGIVIAASGGLLAALRIGPYRELVQIALVMFEVIHTIGLAVEFQIIQRAFEQSAQRESELRRMNEAMERTSQLQVNFLAIMNHEMRTPLTVIAGYADMLGTQAADESNARSLHFIKQEALRLGRIVEQSEDGMVSAMSSDSMEEIDINALFRDVQAFCTPICEKRRNILSIQCPAGLAVTGVRDSLLQALYNLVINASRHTQNGNIKLRAEKKGPEIEITVRDNGDGMDEETMLHAFDKGYTRDGGHGIGLALCLEIVQFHAGHIWIERNDPEKGITVFIVLPEREDN